MDCPFLHKNASPSSAETSRGQYETTKDPLEETDFTEHQISHYHISKITLISFITTEASWRTSV